MDEEQLNRPTERPEISSKEQSIYNALKGTVTLLLGLNFLGWLNAVYALWHRQSLFANGLEKKSFCHINDFIDCDSVAFSKYSSILGSPTANWGMLYYTLATIILLVVFFSIQDFSKSKLSAQIKAFFYLNIVNLVATFVLASISLAVLKTLCLICLLTYILNILSFVFTLRLKKQAISFATSDSTFSQIFSSLGTLALSLMAIASVFHFLLVPKMVTHLISSSPVDESRMQTALSQFLSSTPTAFSSDNAPHYGPNDAPIVITEFSDFQCPYCAVSAKTMPTFLKGYAGSVKYIYKFYPLDSSCNPKMDRAAHPLACRAAKVGYCLYQQKGADAFFKFKENVFSNQQNITSESLMTEATAQGGVEDALKTCVDNSQTHQVVMDHVNEGAAGGVEGTPSIFVNGRLVPTGPNPQVLERVIDEVLKSLKAH